MKWFSQRVNKAYLLLVPSLIFFLVFVFYGALMVILESLRPFYDSSSWTIIYYQKVLVNQAFWDSLFLSIRITVISTLVSLVIGILTTRLLFAFFKNLKWRLLIWMPMLIPHFVAAYMVFLLFGQTGWIASLFFQLGLITDWTSFPIIVNDGSGVGIVLTYVWKQVPFVVLMLLPTYFQLDLSYAGVVRTLGGGTWEVFKTTEWPWLYPVVLETAIILLAFIIAAYEVPALLGVTYPKMLPVLLYQWFSEGNWSNRPMAMAGMALISLSIIILAFQAFRTSQNRRFQLMRGR